MYFHVARLTVFVEMDMLYNRRFASAFNNFERAGVLVRLAGLITSMSKRITG
jgi:hypothetical protein